MSTVYAVLIEDRHADPEVEVFEYPEPAIARAKEIVRESASEPEDIDEEMTEGMIRAGWLYYGRYSCEDDSVRVSPAELK